MTWQAYATHAIVGTITGVLVAIMILVYGCSPTVPSPCTPDQLAAIEGAYVAEAVAACDGQTWESCDALPEVRAKYDAIREEWVACGN